MRLGLGSTQEYKTWCRQHGFSSHLYKGKQQQQRERLVVTRLIATAKLAESSKKPNFSKIIADSFTGSLRPVESRSPWLSTIRRALSTEGRVMHHCVASYAHSCARRATSIWSLQMHNHEGSQRILTVEVRLSSKTICQTRGKRNVMPDAKGKDILRRWAAQEGLRLGIS